MPVLDEITDTITQIQTDMLHSIGRAVERIRLTIKGFTPESLEMKFRRIEQPLLMRLDDAKENLLYTMRARLTNTKHRLALLTRTIEGANPQEILNRGYSIVYNRQTGIVLRKAQDATVAHELRIRLADGEIAASTNE